MKLVLEIHRYAPELNKVRVMKDSEVKAILNAPGIKTIKQARAELFAPLKYTGRHVVLRAVNVPSLKVYNAVNSGFCNDLRSLAGALNAFKLRHNLPACIHTVKTKLIG